MPAQKAQSASSNWSSAGIHVFVQQFKKDVMAGTSPAMTSEFH
jgi:hypothetical protein